MHVERVLSLNGGWSVLTTQKEEEWNEALLALEVINDDYLLGWIKEGDSNPIGYVFMGLCQTYHHLLKTDFSWQTQVPGNDINQEHYRSNCIKNGLLASIAGEDDLISFSFPKLLYITIPYYHHESLIDVAVMFIPTNSLIEYIIKLGAEVEHRAVTPSEEFCRAEAARFIALTGRAPIVLAFFSSTPNSSDEIAVEELSLPKVSAAVIERTIEFAPEHYQASVGLLSYFGEVLRQKDPSTKARVRIEQDGNRVRLHIESPSGDIEIIEKELEQYALVVSRQAAPETLLANRAHIMQLETQLDIARIQVKQAQDVLQLIEGQYTQRINNLEQQVDFLQTQFAVQILQTEQVINLATKQNDSHERLQTTLLTHSATLFKDLLHEASGNQQLAEAVSNLQHNLLSGMATIDIEDKLEQALVTIKETKPGFLSRIAKELEGAAYKASASSAISWVVKWVAAHT